MHSGPFEGAYRPSPQVTTSLEQGRVDDSVLLLDHREYFTTFETFTF